MTLTSRAKNFTFIAITFCLLLLTVSPVLSQGSGLDDDFRDAACGGFTGTAGDCGDSAPVTSLTENVLNILSYVVGAASVIVIVIGGLRYILANGDPQAISAAKNTVLYAVIGLVVAIAAQALVQIAFGAAS